MVMSSINNDKFSILNPFISPNNPTGGSVSDKLSPVPRMSKLSMPSTHLTTAKIVQNWPGPGVGILFCHTTLEADVVTTRDAKLVCTHQ